MKKLVLFIVALGGRALSGAGLYAALADAGLRGATDGPDEGRQRS
jgi:hypothetical protein